MAVYKRTYKDGDGKPSVVYWIDFYFQGKRYRRTAGTSHRKAKDALDRILGRIASGDFDPADLDRKEEGVSFERALDLYREHCAAQGGRDRSYLYLTAPDETSTRPCWPAVFKGRVLSSITSEEIETTLKRWSDDRHWTPGTRNHALMQLSGLFSYAYGRRWIEAHPTEKGRVPLLPVDNARTRWLRLDEIESIRDNAPEWMRPIISFAVMTGMRLGEVCRLRRASYQTDGKGRAFIVTEKTKNGERLHWPLEGAALDLVKTAANTGRFPSSYLFPGPRGGSAESSIRREMPDAVRAAKLKYGRKSGGKAIPDGITFHTFRHSMASLALNAGIPEPVVQRMGNWKTRTMVARYAHLADDTLRDAAGKLAAIVSTKAPRQNVGHDTVTMDRAAVSGASA